MFETAVLSYGSSTKRVWATFAGFTGQVVLIGCALLAPLLWPQVIPRVTWAVAVVGPPPPPPPPPPAGAVVPHHTKAVSQISAGALLAPIHIPSKPAEIIDDEPLVSSGPGVRGGVVGGVENGVPGGVLSSIIDQGRPFVPPPQTVVHETPKTAPAPVVVAKAPVRISQLQLATPIRKVEPVYPYLAKQAHISGTVELVGVLGTDGRIHELHVVSGHPLLIQAAVDAVKQWIFAPTILNGQAVEVQAPIQVRFVLSH